MKPLSKKALSMLLFASSLSAGLTFAGQTDHAPTNAKAFDKEYITVVEEKIKQTFNNLSFTMVRPSEAEGLFEIFAGPNILYFNPENEYLFVGQIYNKNGESITEKSKAEYAKMKIKNLQLENALQMGDPDGIEIIEFGQPECGYCVQANKMMDELSKKYPIKRTYVFVRSDTSRFPGSVKKIEHILCSEDKESAFNAIKDGNVTDYKSCKEGKELFRVHDEIVDSIGVRGTPMFVLGDEVVEGLNMPRIEEYLKSEHQKRLQM